jgi:hypothetical protein
MKELIVIADANEAHCGKLCCMIEELNCRAVAVCSFEDLKNYLGKNDCLVVVLNINTLSVNNRDIRDLTIQNPGVYFLGLTEKRFNPELKEAICYHIFACLTLPVDPEEFSYWINCIRKNSK